ncbi:MAG: PorV/PorQ family protein [Balneolales bacterium]
MQFLNMGPSARSLGMSEAHTAIPSGASSLFTNPALLSLEKQSAGILSYITWGAAGTRNSHAAVNFKRDRDAFAFGIISSLVEDIEQRDSPGEHYLSIAGAYSHDLGPFSLGLTGMFLHEQLFLQNASGVAVSAGAAADFYDERIRLGAALLNYGQMQELYLEATHLPTSIRAGVDIQALQFSTQGNTASVPLLFIISSDYVKPLNEVRPDDENSDIISQDEAHFNLALRVEISEMLILRSGYKTHHPTRSISLGAGVRVNNFDFDYAFAPFAAGFGTAHGISAGYFF